MDVSQGEWVMTNEEYDGTRQGFKVNVLMFDKAPWVEWKKDVLLYREENSEAAFFNEVLGLEYDSGDFDVLYRKSEVKNADIKSWKSS